MILDPTARIAEALRLTRAGRLAEATALLQGVPQKQTSAEASEGFGRESTRTVGRRGRLIERRVPSERRWRARPPGQHSNRARRQLLSLNRDGRQGADGGYKEGNSPYSGHRFDPNPGA